MDDIRRPHSQRRDFAMRHRAHQPPPPTGVTPDNQQAQPPQPAQPAHHQTHHRAPQYYEQLPYSPELDFVGTPPTHHESMPQHHHHPSHQPAHYQQLAPHYQQTEVSQPAPAAEYQHYTPSAHHNQHQSTPKTRSLPKIPIKYPAIAAAVVLLIAAGIALKPSSDQKTIPSTVTKQADFTVYFPSPMPSGYGYMKDTATFQIGDVFFKFSNGKKRVTVKEEATPNPAPNLSLYTGFNQYDVPIGKAVVGQSLGEPMAIVLTTHTVITLNGVGGVTQNDLLNAAKNLQIIGQSSDHKT